jgi:DNA polymerase-3 subunit alpha
MGEAWVPLTCRSHFSLLRALPRTESLPAQLLERGFSAAGLTDYASLAGLPTFVKSAKKAGLKALAGCDFYCCEGDPSLKTAENYQLGHLLAYAKNLAGWKGLVGAFSEASKPEHFYGHARLRLEDYARYAGDNWVVVSGRLGSEVGNTVFKDVPAAFRTATYEEARSLAHSDWRSRLTSRLTKYRDAFGPDFFAEVSVSEAIPASLVAARAVRDVAAKLGIPVVATPSPHYLSVEDASDHRVVTCIGLKCQLKNVTYALAKHQDGAELSPFFRGNAFGMPTHADMLRFHTEEELANTLAVADRCEHLSLSGKPLLPRFDCPDGLSPDDYLRKLCEEGFSKKVPAGKADTYRQRLEYELDTLREFGLASYFLIVEDYVRYARQQLNAFVEPRGSGGGCLVVYLLGISDVDPVRYDLIFERFINRGRMTPEKVSLPDLDIDFPLRVRDKVVAYVRNKYGYEYVAHMATFNRLQGRAALQDVLRVHDRLPFEEITRVTSPIPDESKISDDLQASLEAFEKGEIDHPPSIIRWALENRGDALKEWAWLDEQGNVEGPLGPDFAQAMRLEGTKRSIGKHASGIVACSQPIREVAPLIYDDRSDMPKVGIDMRDAEDAGLVKLDILGCLALDRLDDAVAMIRTGELPSWS